MTRTQEPDWEPRSDAVQVDQVASYDAMRERCPIAYDGNDSWTVFGHADTVAIVDDVVKYSNAVSRHLQIPNGIDGERHREFDASSTRTSPTTTSPISSPRCAASVPTWSHPFRAVQRSTSWPRSPSRSPTTSRARSWDGRTACGRPCATGPRRTAAPSLPSTARDGGDRRRVRHLHPRATRYPPRRYRRRSHRPPARGTHRRATAVRRGDRLDHPQLDGRGAVHDCCECGCRRRASRPAPRRAADTARRPHTCSMLRPTRSSGSTHRSSRADDASPATSRSRARRWPRATASTSVWATANRDPRVFGDPDSSGSTVTPPTTSSTAAECTCARAHRWRAVSCGCCSKRSSPRPRGSNRVRRGSHRPIPAGGFGRLPVNLT